MRAAEACCTPKNIVAAAMKPSATQRVRRILVIVCSLNEGHQSTSARAWRLQIDLADRELEDGAFVRARIDPDVAAMARHDALHDRERYACPGMRRLLLDLLEGKEELPREVQREAGAVVAHAVDREVNAAAAGHLDERHGALPASRDRVCQEIGPDEPQHLAIAAGRGQLAHI